MEEIIEIRKGKLDPKSRTLESALVFLGLGIILGLFSLVANPDIGYKFGLMFCAVIGAIISIAMILLTLFCKEEGESGAVMAISMMLAIIAGVLVFFASSLGYSVVILVKKIAG
jgi:hypothetical protein